MELMGKIIWIVVGALVAVGAMIWLGKMVESKETDSSADKPKA